MSRLEIAHALFPAALESAQNLVRELVLCDRSGDTHTGALLPLSPKSCCHLRRPGGAPAGQVARKNFLVKLLKIFSCCCNDRLSLSLSLDEIITPENVSTDLLKSILDAAFMDVSIDDDGDLLVRDGVRCFLALNEKKDLIQFRTYFTFEAETAELQKFQAVNQINRKYVIVKAVVLDSDSLGFEWDIPLRGGIAKKTFVLALKRFCAIPRSAINDCAYEIVA